MVMMMIKVIVDVYLVGFFKLPFPGFGTPLANFSKILKCFYQFLSWNFSPKG